MIKKVWEKIASTVKAAAGAIKCAAVAFVVGVAVVVKAAAVACATALFEIPAGKIADLEDTVSGASSGSYGVYLLIVAFAIVWALTRRLKGK